MHQDNRHFEDAPKLAAGPVMRALLADILPHGMRALIAGPHELQMVELVAGRSEHVTVLLRSPSDATALGAALKATNVSVVTGAIDAFVDRPGLQKYDVVVAADGLDRLLSADSPILSWPERAAVLARATATDGLVVLGCDNAFALTSLLDRRPFDRRHDDAAWRGLHDDPERPASPDQLAVALAEAGLGDAAVYAVFGAPGFAHTLLDTATAAVSRPGGPAARLAVRALEASVDTFLAAPPSDPIHAASRAGLLAAVATSWVAVCGGASGAHAVYSWAGAPENVLTADTGPQGWLVQVTAGERGAAGNAVTVDEAEPAEARAPAVVLSPEGVPALVPDTESVEQLLLRLAAAGDEPGFRRVAAQLGEWVRERCGATTVICLDDLGVNGGTFAPGLSGWVTTADASSGELLAAAWHRFQDRLVREQHRHPWPPRMVGDELVSAWLAMSGEEATVEAVKRGREIADGVAKAEACGPGSQRDVDARRALADAEATQLRVQELSSRILTLERAIEIRDQQLRVRESRIRALRQELRTIRGSRALRLAEVIQRAAKIRHPRQFASGVKRRLRRALER